MGKLHAARVKQQEAVKDASRHLGRIEARLNLLAEDLPLLVASVDQSIVVFHLGLPLSDLDHVIQISDFDRERFLLSVDEALVSAHAGAFAATVALYIVDLRVVDGSCHTDCLQLVVGRHEIEVVECAFVLASHGHRLQRRRVLELTVVVCLSFER